MSFFQEKDLGKFNLLLRGGQRSRSLALVLNEIGWRISILKGGYKNYRKLVLDELNDLINLKFSKDKLGLQKQNSNCLNNMNAQVIDLENLVKI